MVGSILLLPPLCKSDGRAGAVCRLFCPQGIGDAGLFFGLIGE
jgi:hypothetical protein